MRSTRIETIIKAILENDVSIDNTLDNPLYLGIVLSNISVPTIDLGNGAVARIDVGIRANDGAETAIPEPTSTLALLALGTLGTASTLKRKLKLSNPQRKS